MLTKNTNYTFEIEKDSKAGNLEITFLPDKELLILKNNFGKMFLGVKDLQQIYNQILEITEK